jgi:hypothetical protein
MWAAIVLKLCTWLYIYDLQIKFEDGCYRPIFRRVLLLELSVFRTSFSLFTDIHLIFGTLICHTKIQIKFEFGFDPLIFPKVIAYGLRKISRIISFPDFCSLCLQIFIWYLVHYFVILRYKSSLSLVSIHWFFPKLWPLDFENYHKLSVFPCLQIFIWYLVHCFAIPRYIWSLSLISIHWFFPMQWHRKISRITRFPSFLFFSAYR